ncbi:MAG: hypothetical protein Q4Q62_08005, partial [Thermoplasmata archaeon]|nr:hypothetical protein [Thermoplasmata archaeon]
MQIRLMSYGSEGSEELEYAGVRDEAKLKEFVMTDLLASYVYRSAANWFHLSGGDSSKDERVEAVRAMSRAFALDYHGDNVG